MTQSKTYDMIVIGAGISGLSLANQIARSGKKVLILEAANKIGGCLNTLYQDDFWVEMGAHTFYATYANLIELIQQNGLENEIVAREKVGMKVFTDRHEKIMKPVNKWELIGSVPKLFFSKRDGKTVKEYFGNIVGMKNYQKVFTRMFSAVIVQNADEFSAEYFLKRRNTKSKEHPKSFVLKAGMSSFMNALANHENVTVELNAKVNGLEKIEDSFAIKTELGEEYQCKDVALAASTAVNAKLLQHINPDLSDILADFPVQNIESRAVIFPKEQIQFDPVSFIIPLQGPCFSMVTRDVMTHDKMRGFAFHFEENQISEKKQKDFMCELLKVSELNGETVVAKHRLPLIKIGHEQRIERMKQLSEESGIYLTGNFFNGLSLEDCVERSKQEFERYCKNTGAL